MRDIITLAEQANRSLVESTAMYLGDLISVSTTTDDADFWIERRGSTETVGRPTKTPSPHAYGIKVTATDVLDPQYLYYMMQHLWSSGKWRQVATGTTALVNIKKTDILNIPVG